MPINRGLVSHTLQTVPGGLIHINTNNINYNIKQKIIQYYCYQCYAIMPLCR